jgi:hypothetical protein
MAGTEPTDALRVNRYNLSVDIPFVKHKSTGRERPTHSTRQASTKKKCTGCVHQQSREGDWSVMGLGLA